MQSIYTYIPETNYVCSEYSVAAIVLFLFMVHTSLAPVLNLLHFYWGFKLHRSQFDAESYGLAVKDTWG
jgi:hypothetical protein